MDNRKYPEKGTKEYHLKMLKKLRAWLRINPKNNPVVVDEVSALDWVLKQIGEE